MVSPLGLSTGLTWAFPSGLPTAPPLRAPGAPQWFPRGADGSPGICQCGRPCSYPWPFSSGPTVLRPGWIACGYPRLGFHLAPSMGPACLLRSALWFSCFACLASIVRRPGCLQSTPSLWLRWCSAWLPSSSVSLSLSSMSACLRHRVGPAGLPFSGRCLGLPWGLSCLPCVYILEADSSAAAAAPAVDADDADMPVAGAADIPEDIA